MTTIYLQRALASRTVDDMHFVIPKLCEPTLEVPPFHGSFLGFRANAGKREIGRAHV